MRKIYPFLIIGVLAVGLAAFAASRHRTHASGIIPGYTQVTPSPSVNPDGSGTASGSASYKDGTFTGADVQTPYGDVQIAAVVSSGKITQIKFLQLPADHGRSVEISNYAAPQLQQEALQSQSASVDIVSGATSTSEGFIESLQQALGQARQA